eukprot:542347-Pyramimonas_sp.AAC.2
MFDCVVLLDVDSKIPITDVLSPAVKLRMQHLIKFIHRLLEHRELRYSWDLHTFLCEVCRTPPLSPPPAISPPSLTSRQRPPSCGSRWSSDHTNTSPSSHQLASNWVGHSSAELEGV